MIPSFEVNRMRRKILLLAGLLVAWSSPARAQLPQWVTDLLAAAQLPVSAAQARVEGVRNADIRSILDAMRRSNIPVVETVALLDTARATHREYGPMDNFGAFVQSQLAAGKRGRDLAAAIRAEHARMGKGNAGRAGGPGMMNVPPGQARGNAGNAADSVRGNKGDENQGRGKGAAKPVTPGREGPPAGTPGKKPEGRGRPPIR